MGRFLTILGVIIALSAACSDEGPAKPNAECKEGGKDGACTSGYACSKDKNGKLICQQLCKEATDCQPNFFCVANVPGRVTLVCVDQR